MNQPLNLLVNIKELSLEVLSILNGKPGHEKILNDFLLFMLNILDLNYIGFYEIDNKRKNFVGKYFISKNKDEDLKQNFYKNKIFLEQKQGVFNQVNISKKPCFVDEKSKIEQYRLEEYWKDFFHNKNIGIFPLLFFDNVDGLLLINPCLAHNNKFDDDIFKILIEQFSWAFATIRLKQDFDLLKIGGIEKISLEDKAIRARKILVVDPDEEQSYLLKEILLSHGHEVSLTSTEEEALSILRYENFDTLLVEKDAFDLHNLSFKKFFHSKKVKKENIDIEVIILADIDKSVDFVGAKGIIPKPYDSRSVLVRIFHILEKQVSLI